MKWYSFKPTDTLFFRGAEPLEKGVSHNASVMFPPPASTIKGALRTACLQQNNIKIDDYHNGNVTGTLLGSIGKADEDAPFDIIGPILKKDTTYYIPAPYSWFYSKGDIDTKGDSFVVAKTIFVSKLARSNLVKTPIEFQWVFSDKPDLVSAGGMWISLQTLHDTKAPVKLFNTSNFYVLEERTGIALDNRTVREGHLYTMSHIRLKEDVEIIFGINKKLPLSTTEVLKLGGEQRFGLYKTIHTIPELDNIKSTGTTFLSLSPVQADGNSTNTVATGKIIYIGGWDMKKGFHKEMVGYYPAGTVFNKKINANCISLMEDN